MVLAPKKPYRLIFTYSILTEVDQEFIMDAVWARRFPQFKLIEININLFNGKLFVQIRDINVAQS